MIVSLKDVWELRCVRRQLSITRNLPSGCLIKNLSIGLHRPLPNLASNDSLEHRGLQKPFSTSSKVVARISSAKRGGRLTIIWSTTSDALTSHWSRGGASLGLTARKTPDGEISPTMGCPRTNSCPRKVRPPDQD